MHKTMLALAAAAVMAATPALADPIVGNWRTGEGGSVAIGPCGSAFCVQVTAGEHAGRQIGRFSRDGDRYRGRITDPAEDRTYRGTAWFEGDTLKMRGSVLGGLFGRTESWTRR